MSRTSRCSLQRSRARLRGSHDSRLVRVLLGWARVLGRAQRVRTVEHRPSKCVCEARGWSDEKKQMVANVEKQLEEAKELLEQMDLEVREIPPQSRGMYNNRMRSYKQEMGKLETDFKRSRIAYSDEVRNELLGDDGNSSENQRAHLLDNTERLERSSRRLEAGYQIAVETEQIGQEMLENLSHDREKIQRARERLRETDANLGKSSRILTGMLRRIIQNRILLVILGIIVVITILMAITFSVRRH
nr:vesicle transport through interaction with t-SNAREs homolog 1A isoform X1 [Saimiri boliviensis boliviensis]